MHCTNNENRQPIESDQRTYGALDQANDEDIVVRLADGREFLLSAVDDFEIEIVQTRQNEKLMALLAERARQTHTLPLDEVMRRLGIAE